MVLLSTTMLIPWMVIWDVGPSACFMRYTFELSISKIPLHEYISIISFLDDNESYSLLAESRTRLDAILGYTRVCGDGVGGIGAAVGVAVSCVRFVVDF